MINKNKVIEMLETVLDPEVGIDIWTMGLIYDINIIDDKSIKILMTFTSPMCPLGEHIVKEVEQNMKELGFTDIKTEVTFNPPWEPSQELRDMMGI